MKHFGLASSLPGPSPMPLDVRQSAIDRCHREQSEIRAMGEDKPAWLTTLGLEDWEMEKRFIAHVERAISGSTENSGEAKTC
jgi:hypothetical protein